MNREQCDLLQIKLKNLFGLISKSELHQRSELVDTVNEMLWRLARTRKRKWRSSVVVPFHPLPYVECHPALADAALQEAEAQDFLLAPYDDKCANNHAPQEAPPVFFPPIVAPPVSVQILSPQFFPD